MINSSLIGLNYNNMISINSYLQSKLRKKTIQKKRRRVQRKKRSKTNHHSEPGEFLNADQNV